MFSLFYDDFSVWIGPDIACVEGYGSGVWIGLWVQGMDQAVHVDSQPNKVYI